LNDRTYWCMGATNYVGDPTVSNSHMKPNPVPTQVPVVYPASCPLPP
jgi:hypothetical protein